MEVKVLTNSNFASLSTKYGVDNNVEIITDSKSSYQGLNLNLSNSLLSANDSSINFYSSFYLTDSKKYSDFVKIAPLTLPSQFTFTSYIAFGSNNNLNTASLFLSSFGDSKSPTSEISFSKKITENTFFEILFLNNNDCKIKNTQENTVRYLTYNYLDSKFLFLTGNDSKDNEDLNTFQYNYDKENNVISFYKKIYDKLNVLTFDRNNSSLVFDSTDLVSGSIPFKSNQIFRLRNNNSVINSTLSSGNYVYEKNLDVSKINIDKSRTTLDYGSNFLINSEYYNINPYTNNYMDINLLNLKNEKSVKNYQTYGGVFLNQPDFKHRYYENLYTGVNQEKGNSNIGLGFASYTLSTNLKADTLNYFHIPYDIYPYEKLNVNDSSLVKSGATSSDTPYYSDKIFKRLNDYKYSSPFGEVSDTQTGSYLCTWLSGGNSINDEGLWVDRYYNPNNVSHYDSLTNPSTGLVTNFDTISSLVGNNNLSYDIYDVKSSLTFEKGALYAYHHVGNENCQSYVNSISSNLIVNNFDYYYTSTWDRKVYEKQLKINFDNFTRVLDNSLDTVSKFDNFTINFDMYNEDYQTPFGSQIIGNYTNVGFGIFNYRKITPYTCIFRNYNNSNCVYIFNTLGRLLKKVEFENEITRLLMFEPNSFFLVFDKQGNVFKVTYNGGIIDKKYLDIIDPTLTVQNGSKDNEIFYCNYGNYAFILVSNKWYRLDIDTLEYKAQSSLTDTYNTFYVGPYNEPMKSIVVKDTNVYLLSGYRGKILDNEIYYFNFPFLNYYDIETGDVKTRVEGYIIDYCFDSNKNLFLLNNDSDITVINDLDIITTTEKLSNITGIDQGNYSCLIDVVDEWYGGKHITNDLSIISLSSNTYDSFPVYSRVSNNLLSSTSVVQTDRQYLQPFENFISNENINNYNYNYNNYDNGENLSAKIKLKNEYDTQTYETATVKIPLSSISAGWHNITITFDTIEGLFNLLIDGSVVDTYTFSPGKYSFGTVFDNSLYVGTEPAYGNNKLNDLLKDYNYYNYGLFKLKDFYMYNKALYLYEIANIVRTKYNVQDVIFELPTGKRSYVENISKFFKNKLPGRKSNLINLGIQDTNITEKSLKNILSKEIRGSIQKALPANTKLKDIKWETDD